MVGYVVLTAFIWSNIMCETLPVNSYIVGKTPGSLTTNSMQENYWVNLISVIHIR